MSCAESSTTGRSQTRPYGRGSMKNGLVDYGKNLQQIEAVSSPSAHQTPEPSLLFPSTITAFLTGSRTDGSGHWLRVRLVGEMGYTHQSTGGSEPHER